MSAFALLWGKLLRSSLWVTESKETRLVWVAMLAMKDEEGRVYSSVAGLADAAKVSLEECKEALRVLLAPDEGDTSKVEEGRRLREISGGWEVVNNDLYRYSSEEKREFWRKQKALQRAIKAGGELDPSMLTEAQLKVWKAAREKGRRDALKRVKRSGEVEGRTEVIGEALQSAEDDLARENKDAERLGNEGEE